MKFFLFLNIIFIPFIGMCQDSIQKKPSESWRNFYIPKTLLRVGLGYQKSLYGELGVIRRKYGNKIGFDDMAISGFSYYGSIEWTPSKDQNNRMIYGVKVGGELTLQFLLIGLESKCQTDFINSNFVITPKIGLGDALISGALVSHIYFCYGYNISLNNIPFANIGNHQFSMFINPIVLSYLLNKRNYTKKFYK
jgi:hypothetical protein